MSPFRTILTAALLALAPLAAVAAERPARPRLCPEDAPEGVRLPAQPGCGPRSETPPRNRARDFGEDLEIRVGGRVGAGFGMQR